MAIVINGSGTVTGVNATGISSAPTNATDATKLPLAGGSLTGNLTVGSVTDPTISLLSNANDNATSGRLKFREGDGVNGFDIRYNGSANQAVIDTTAVSNALTIARTTGNVGIGTASVSFPSGTGLEVYDSSIPRIKLANSTTGNASTDGFDIHISGSDVKFWQRENAAMSFATNGTERLQITSNGRISTFGSSNAAAALNLVGEGGASYKCLSFERTAGGGEVGNIVANSSSTSYNTSSDHRLKENVVDMENATDRVKQLKPKRFNFIADDSVTVDGFLAHEVSDIVPEAISGEKDAMRNETDEEGNVTSVPDYQGIDQSKLVPLLVKTIQELEARITALEA